MYTKLNKNISIAPQENLLLKYFVKLVFVAHWIYAEVCICCITI